MRFVSRLFGWLDVLPQALPIVYRLMAIQNHHFLVSFVLGWVLPLVCLLLQGELQHYEKDPEGTAVLHLEKVCLKIILQKFLRNYGSTVSQNPVFHRSDQFYECFRSQVIDFMLNSGESIVGVYVVHAMLDCQSSMFGSLETSVPLGYHVVLFCCTTATNPTSSTDFGISWDIVYKLVIFQDITSLESLRPVESQPFLATQYCSPLFNSYNLFLRSLSSTNSSICLAACSLIPSSLYKPVPFALVFSVAVRCRLLALLFESWSSSCFPLSTSFFSTFMLVSFLESCISSQNVPPLGFTRIGLQVSPRLSIHDSNGYFHTSSPHLLDQTSGIPQMRLLSLWFVMIVTIQLGKW